jgi:hypothetical protein
VSNIVLSRFIISLYVTAALLTTMIFPSAFNYKSDVDAQVIVVDEPPTNATEELDVKIDATEPLPPNGTIMVDIAEADDIEINAIPPEGVSVIMTNTTVTVTNSPVEIEEDGEESDTASIATGTTAEDDEEEPEGSTGNNNSDDQDDIDGTEVNAEDDEE